MANTSIYNAFERMWQHNVAKLETIVGSDIFIDATLTQSGQAADAKVVGDRFVRLEREINSGVTINDDGNGNIVFEVITQNISVEDDGNGNITIF